MPGLDLETPAPPTLVTVRLSFAQTTQEQNRGQRTSSSLLANWPICFTWKLARLVSWVADRACTSRAMPCRTGCELIIRYIALTDSHSHIHAQSTPQRAGGRGTGRIQHTGAPFLIPTPSSRPRMVTYGWPLIICWTSSRTVLGSLGPGLN